MLSDVQHFLAVREYTAFICQHLLLEDYHLQPIDDVSPPKWHLAHTSWFFETFILKDFSDYICFDPHYNFLFNSYYETVGPRWQRAARGDLSRPPVADIYAYRTAINTAIQQRYDQLSPRQLDLLELGIHHEQQHQELLLTDLKYSLGINPLFPALLKPPPRSAPPPPPAQAAWHRIPEGVYSIGHEGQSFHFDNEKGRHQVFINPCEVALQPVTNREYLAFMASGGYTHSRHWLSDAWDWIHTEKITAPLHWHQRDGEWFTFTLYGLTPLDLDAPVTHISYFEADAYARSHGVRLPTEFEWEVAAQQCEGSLSEHNTAHFLESQQWQPVAHAGFFGNVWEWTSSAYLPYPGFAQAPGAVGEYNGKFMNGQYVLRGGSCVTPISHIRPTYRNFFMPDKRWQFTGIRLARCVKEQSC
jgi:ergothioneine biosynthesis protein EgtB